MKDEKEGGVSREERCTLRQIGRGRMEKYNCVAWKPGMR